VNDGADHVGEEDGIVVGDADYLRAVLPAGNPGPEFRKRDWTGRRPALTELLANGGTPASVAAAYRMHGYTLSSIAQALGCHVSTVSRRLKAYERQMLDCKI
jgi:AraC-like DNA-binding protein